MKKLISLASMALVAALTVPATAQTVLDDFETDTSGDWTIQGFGGESISVENSAGQGADGTDGWFALLDGGFSYFVERTFTAPAPSDGNYKITFSHQNGGDVGAETGTTPMKDVNIEVNGVPVLALYDSTAPAISSWTTAETSTFSLLATDDVEFRFTTASNGGGDTYGALLDEIELVEVTNVPITAKLRPLDGQFLAGTVTLEVENLAGGSGNYSTAELDLDDDDTVDLTDSTPGDGFSFEIDTTTLFEGPLTLSVTVTDDASNTGEFVANYTVANAAGRQELLNEDFENFVSGLPDGWTRVDWDGFNDATTPATSGTTDVVVAENTTDPFDGSASLQLTNTDNPDPNRYTVASPNFDASKSDYILTFAAKGDSFTRLCFFDSVDGVDYYVGTLISPSAAGVWQEFLSDDYSPNSNGDMPADATVAKLTTHIFGADGEHYYDNIRLTSSINVTLDAENWDLY